MFKINIKDSTPEKLVMINTDKPQPKQYSIDINTSDINGCDSADDKNNILALKNKYIDTQKELSSEWFTKLSNVLNQNINDNTLFVVKLLKLYDYETILQKHEYTSEYMTCLAHMIKDDNTITWFINDCNDLADTLLLETAFNNKNDCLGYMSYSDRNDDCPVHVRMVITACRILSITDKHDTAYIIESYDKDMDLYTELARVNTLKEALIVIKAFDNDKTRLVTNDGSEIDWLEINNMYFL